MTLSNNVSLGDLFVVAGLVGSVIYNYAVYTLTIRRIQDDVEDLKRGRGFIFGAESSWPVAVQRCFGMIDRNNPGEHTRGRH